MIRPLIAVAVLSALFPLAMLAQTPPPAPATPPASAPATPAAPVTAGSAIGPSGTGSADSPQKLIGKIIRTVLGVMGSIALLMFVIGGATWMTAGGNEKRVQQGRDTIVWATLGLVVIMAAYGIVDFLIESLAV